MAAVMPREFSAVLVNGRGNYVSLRRLGLGHDERRSIATTDVPFYRWTQWIFLQLFNAWFDEQADGGRCRARPIDELVEAYSSGERTPDDGSDWAALDDVERR